MQYQSFFSTGGGKTFPYLWKNNPPLPYILGIARSYPQSYPHFPQGKWGKFKTLDSIRLEFNSTMNADFLQNFTFLCEKSFLFSLTFKTSPGDQDMGWFIF